MMPPPLRSRPAFAACGAGPYFPKGDLPKAACGAGWHLPKATGLHLPLTARVGDHLCHDAAGGGGEAVGAVAPDGEMVGGGAVPTGVLLRIYV